ncbi:MAG: thymidine phosphorylase [Planctomycetota bacterium]
MDVRDAIRCKRDGGDLGEGAIREFLGAYVAGEAEDYHAAALLMAIFIRGMKSGELQSWTRAMLESGARLSWSDMPGPVVDKHSTGGIGDKSSLVLAPALAALGCHVPMISGRGLGHTGGTLDKLEAIDGFRIGLSLAELDHHVRSIGLAFGAQTPELVPADRKLYALRDAAGLVESIPLIASSIMSKKLAEGLDALVLDVKFGTGAFLPEPAEGRRLAEAMGQIAAGFDLPLRVVMSSMEQPLGRMVGHAMEVNECLDVMDGGGPEDLVELTCLLGAQVLVAAGRFPDPAQAGDAVLQTLRDGRALGAWEAAVQAQGGKLQPGARLAETGQERVVFAPRSGFLAFADCREVGLALLELGGARRSISDAIDHQVGIECLVRHGDRVEVGQPLARVAHRGGRGLDEALAHLGRAWRIQEFPPEPTGPPSVL